MDDIIFRPRYPRHKTHRRRRKVAADTYDYKQKAALQVLICILLLSMAVAVKNINTPTTRYLREKISWAFSKNIEVESLFEGIDKMVGFIFTGNKPQEKDDEDPKKYSFPTSTEDTGLLSEEYRADGETATDYVADNDNKAVDTKKDDNVGKESPIQGSREPEDKSQAKSLFIPPVTGPVGSPFGERTHPIKKTKEFHRGIDIEADNGVAIKVVMDGEVIEAGSEKTFGNYIKVKHAEGFETVYAHCSLLAAKKGQKVKQGDVIARVGNTGASIGAHLHLELWKDGKAVDPLLYIKMP